MGKKKILKAPFRTIYRIGVYMDFFYWGLIGLEKNQYLPIFPNPTISMAL